MRPKDADILGQYALNGIEWLCCRVLDGFHGETGTDAEDVLMLVQAENVHEGTCSLIPYLELQLFSKAANAPRVMGLRGGLVRR